MLLTLLFNRNISEEMMNKKLEKGGNRAAVVSGDTESGSVSCNLRLILSDLVQIFSQTRQSSAHCDND